MMDSTTGCTVLFFLGVIVGGYLWMMLLVILKKTYADVFREGWQAGCEYERERRIP
jgi:hypothetical protein